ncbi:hypothetical protein AURDEDRAFT_171841 [Auricularia subglabra TFB-10046 SS5]|uniref:Uncharacterized protein n=1 Tax=Auricularia subglabra (strain TFB-10046 / SS5) TaxID=717982 RepID=J0WX27_AURST|nr:hypothetical protein AURDEDRAFT_171841 [Auricularia subglabra TFB-10046 SS5]
MSHLEPHDADLTVPPVIQMLELPKWEEWPVEPLGTDRYTLDDDMTSRAAALLPQEWFLGVIMANGLLVAVHPDGSGSDLLNFRFTLVGEGLPDPAHESFPIAPAVQTSESRPAFVLPSENSLPWPNLYAHTCSSRNALISRVHFRPCSLASCLSAEQLDSLNDAVMDDLYNRDTLRLDAEASAPVHEAPGPPSDEDCDSEIGRLAALSLDEDMQYKLRGARLYVELSFDRAVCPGLPASPALYDELVRRIDDIWDDWELRMLREIAARGPRQTAEWIQAMADVRDEFADEEDGRGLFEGPLDDEAVLPEDAIDMRGAATPVHMAAGRIARISHDSFASSLASLSSVPNRAASLHDYGACAEATTEQTELVGSHVTTNHTPASYPPTKPAASEGGGRMLLSVRRAFSILRDAYRRLQARALRVGGGLSEKQGCTPSY